MKTERIRYWKKEIDNDCWKPVADNGIGLELVVKQGAMFCTWNAFSEPYKGNGQSEPIRYGDMPLDFDSKENPEKALIEMRNLCLVQLQELYDIDPNEIKFYCSGSKGFHAVIPAELFGAQDGDPYLPYIYKEIASEWVNKFRMSTLDLTMYAMGKGKMFRIANVKRSNGRYKVPLTMEEIRDLSIEKILKLSERPREI